MTTEKATGRDSDKFMLRFPDGMRDRIAEVAKTNGRSMNAEIVARLAQSFEGIPELFRSNIEDAANKWGVPFYDALERVISAGLDPSAPEVVIIHVDGTVKADQMAQLFDVGRTKIKKDASIIFERK